MTVNIKDITSGYIKEIQALKDERDALKSNLDKIKRKVFEAYNAQLNVSFDNKVGVYEVFQLLGDCFEVAKETPQQCLRDVKAEASRTDLVVTLPEVYDDDYGGHMSALAVEIMLDDAGISYKKGG